MVYFEPTDRTGIVLEPMNETIVTQNKQFSPLTLAITAGSQVNFPNMDRILHNVFSVSTSHEFDLGLYSAGTSKAVTFAEPGIIYVHCNVHHYMHADILVLDTPYFTYADETGKFELSGMPNLDGVIKIWHPRGVLKTIPVTKDNNNMTINHTVDIIREKVPKHTNKFGKSYRPTKG